MFSVTKTGMWRLPLWTPKVKPTMSGEIVERRDHVLIAGGFFPPSAIRCSVRTMLKSINGPFFNERGIFQFWILDCRFWIGGLLSSAIQNPKSKIQNQLTFFVCPSRSYLSCAYFGESCSRVSAVPTGSPGCGRRRYYLHRRREGDRPGSSRRRGPSDACPSSVSGPPFRG